MHSLASYSSILIKTFPSSPESTSNRKQICLICHHKSQWLLRGALSWEGIWAPAGKGYRDWLVMSAQAQARKWCSALFISHWWNQNSFAPGARAKPLQSWEILQDSQDCSCHPRRLPRKAHGDTSSGVGYTADLSPGLVPVLTQLCSLEKNQYVSQIFIKRSKQRMSGTCWRIYLSALWNIYRGDWYG